MAKKAEVTEKKRLVQMRGRVMDVLNLTAKDKSFCKKFKYAQLGKELAEAAGVKTIEIKDK